MDIADFMYIVAIIKKEVLISSRGSGDMGGVGRKRRWGTDNINGINIILM